MRSKFSLISSGYCLWTLVLAMSLVLLMAIPRSWFLDKFSITTTTIEIIQSPLILPSKGQGFPPVLAYWISGTDGDSTRILRLLKAIYHPRNQYLLHLDSEASEQERGDLVLLVESESTFRAFGNVNVVGRSYAINQMGASALSAVLHAAALLLKLRTDWDWFINLSASDYPLVTQDDILHAISSLPRDLNLIDYANISDWKERRNINQIVVDPSLHLQKKSHLFYAVETRTEPDAFEIYGGSPRVFLTRSFMEYCIQGWDNLPRKLLMYFSNTASPIDYYFHTVLCNSPEFRNTTLKTDLRFNILQSSAEDGEGSPFDRMLNSQAAFARPFREGNPVLDMIDEHVLNRVPNGVVPGKWCLDDEMRNDTESSTAEKNPCSSSWGNIDVLNPGSYGTKLGLALSKLYNERKQENQCDP
ncbi:hypothetical protein K2173_010887 [Erythroxylum novogranatense]|uniref:Uncharacterized protein n=1 Tax=Erythroxylum novogranatense TaxID=1862640 RepID=A0AAV8SZY2_9ROSI|nr:hypothetical protein K2173_010887 [Erythroxylum novogranatense]